MISISHLTKRYGGRRVLDDVSLQVAPGSICGLLGLNGAGKSTTFRCALGLAASDAGEAQFDDEPLRTQTFERLAYVPDRPSLYPWLTVGQHVLLAERSYRTSRSMTRIAPLPRACGRGTHGQPRVLFALCHSPLLAGCMAR